MTRPELNTYIDTNITDKTAVDSLTPTNEGEALKAVADYVDQEIIVKTIKVNISHSELLNLNSSPKEILPPVEGKAYLPIQMFAKYIDNLGWGTEGTPWRIKINGATVVSFSTQIGSGAVNEEFRLSTATTTADTYFNKSVVLEANANLASPVDPNTTAEVRLQYFEITT